MLSFLKSAYSSNSTDTSTKEKESTDLVVASEQLSLTHEYGLVGLQEALTHESNFLHMPEANLANAVVGVQMITNGTSAIVDYMEGSASDTITKTQVVTSGIIWGLSNGAQLLKYFSNFSKLKTATNELILGLPLDLIKECQVKNNAAITLKAPFSTESISKFLTTNSKILIKFIGSDDEIELTDFGFFTPTVARPAIAATATTVATELINIGYYLASEAGVVSADQAASLRIVANVTTNLPLIDIASRLAKSCNNHTTNFINALNTVVKIYTQQKMLHDLPIPLFETIGQFVDKKYMDKNREYMKQYITEHAVLALEEGKNSKKSKPKLIKS